MNTNYINEKIQIIKKIISKIINKEDLKYVFLILQGKIFEEIREKNLNIGRKISEKFKIEKVKNLKEKKCQEIIFFLRDLEKIQKKDSLKIKIKKIKIFLNELSEVEQKIFLKLISNRFSITISERIIIKAFSKYFVNKKFNYENLLKTYNLYPNLLKNIENWKKGFLINYIEYFNPFRPMLPKKFNEKKIKNKFIIEPKYDGIRIILHKKNKKIKLYSRILFQIENHFEEIENEFLKIPGNWILDGEIVPYSFKKKVLPYNEVAKRIGLIDEEKIQLLKNIKLKFHIFDIIKLDQKMIIERNLIERKKILSEIFNKKYLVPYKIISKENFSKEKNQIIEKFPEGVLIKNIESKYFPGERKDFWMKYKEYKETLDVVVIGGNYLKENNQLFGSFLVALKEKTYNLISLCKIGIGFSKKDLIYLKKKLIESEKIKNINYKEKMDVYFVPEVILEISYIEISKGKKGISLRFPKFIKLRSDKNIEEIDHIEKLK